MEFSSLNPENLHSELREFASRSKEESVRMENDARYTITLDDDPMVCKLIARATGINSLPFTSVESLLKRYSSYQPVAVFVDIHLDEQDCGLDIIPHLRKTWPFIPIIVVTGDDKEDLVIEALASGADDFVKKPLNSSELTGRLRARLRDLKERERNDVISVSDIRFSVSKLSIECGEKIAFLPKLEAGLLATLVQNKDMLIPRKELKNRLWGRSIVSDNTLDKKISGVRKALSFVGSSMKIQSIYGQGVKIS